MLAAAAPNGAAAEPGGATVTILRAVSAVEEAPLNFGRIVVPDGGGSITVGADGTVTCTKRMQCAGTPQAAAFRITGSTGARVGIDMPDSATLTGSGGTVLTVTLMPTRAFVDIDAGENRVTIGGSLAIGVDALADEYHGTFALDIVYQ